MLRVALPFVALRVDLDELAVGANEGILGKDEDGGLRKRPREDVGFLVEGPEVVRVVIEKDVLYRRPAITVVDFLETKHVFVLHQGVSECREIG